MDFAFTDQQQQIRDEVLKLCARFDDGYWLERDRSATFPDAFFAAMAEANWLGIAMPEAYGGAGLGITEATILMQAVAVGVLSAWLYIDHSGQKSVCIACS